MTIGDRIKERRKKLDMTSDELADKLGKSRATIYRYENGDIKNLPTTILEPLAEALYTTPAYLMGWTDEPDDWERIANEEGICPPNGYGGDPEDWFEMKMLKSEDCDLDLSIIQRERSKMSAKEKTKLMNILKANFDEYNWEEDDSGDIE